MIPQEAFGVVVRSVGLLLTVGAMGPVLYVLLGVVDGDAADTLFIAGGSALLAGLYLLRGAPGLVAFAYPSWERSSSTSDPKEALGQFERRH